MRIVRSLIVVFTLASFGCNHLVPGIPGSGKLVTESRPVSGFNAVVLKGSGQLVVEVNGSESLSISADDNLLPYLTSEISGGQLILGVKDNANLDSTQITYKLSAKDLNAIEVSGSGSIDAKNVHADRLKIVVGGSGNLTAAGAADQQEVTVAGSGNYDGGNVKSKAVTVSVLGSGDAKLNASERLNATIAGSGSVKYSGDAVVTKQILGSGSVQKQ